MENFNTNLDDPLEIFKLSKEDAHVYKLLPMSSSEGYTSEDFVELVFRGKMRVSVKGENLFVYFINKDNTVAYASMVNENIDQCVMRTRDSTRYFGMRAVNDKGMPCYIGLGIIAII